MDQYWRRRARVVKSLSLGLWVYFALHLGTSSVWAENAAATVVTTEKRVWVSFDYDNPATGGSYAGWLYVQATEGLWFEDARLVNGIRASATAYSRTDDPDGSSSEEVFFDQQEIPEGALSMDAIGNSARVTACLFPEGGGSCRHFDLTFSQPERMYVICDQPLYALGCVDNTNAWYDLEALGAGGTVGNTAEVQRADYKISGLWNEQPFAAARYPSGGESRIFPEMHVVVPMSSETSGPASGNPP